MKKMMNFSTIYKYFATSKSHIFYTLQQKVAIIFQIATINPKLRQNPDKKTKIVIVCPFPRYRHPYHGTWNQSY